MRVDRSFLVNRLAVYLVADPAQNDRSLVEVVEQALLGGVTSVQLRAKRLTDLKLFELASQLKLLCERHSAMFIVNDRVDIALAVAADGVHLGVDDLPVSAARSIAPAEFVIGYSPDSDEDAARAAVNGADYLGVGPIFGTVSKDDAGEAIGNESLQRRAQLAGIPVIGIGGVNAENAASVVEAGAVGVAVISAILRSDDPRLAAQQLSSAVSHAKNAVKHGA